MIHKNTVKGYWLCRSAPFILFLGPFEFDSKTLIETPIKHKGKRYWIYTLVVTLQMVRTLTNLGKWVRRLGLGGDENWGDVSIHLYHLYKDICHVGFLLNALFKMEEFSSFMTKFFHLNDRMIVENPEVAARVGVNDGCHYIRRIVLPMSHIISTLRFLQSFREPGKPELLFSYLVSKNSPLWMKLLTASYEGFWSTFALYVAIASLTREIMYCRASAQWVRMLRESDWQPGIFVARRNIVMGFRIQQVINSEYNSAFQGFGTPLTYMSIFGFASILGYNVVSLFGEIPLRKYLFFPSILFVSLAYALPYLQSVSKLFSVSEQTINDWKTNRSNYLRKFGKSCKPLEIKVASFYSFGTNCPILFMNDVLIMIVNLLCTFKT